MTEHSTPSTFLDETRRWVAHFVIRWRLCPFAKAPFDAGRIRWVLSEATTPETLLADARREWVMLDDLPAAEVETTLLVHPYVLSDFFDYNDFLGEVEDGLAEDGLEGVLQVASFHPDYQFAGVPFDDPANETNRSPYPMLHIIREESISKVVDTFPNIDSIPERNVELLRGLGEQERRAWQKT